jgi:hypothetical protein
MSCLTILVMPMVSLARCVRRTHAELRHDAQKLSHKTLTPRVMCRGEDSMRITHSIVLYESRKRRRDADA